MKSKLKIISNINDGGLFINNNNNLSYIDSNGKIVVIDELDSNDRPIYLSELFNKLNSRRWNNVVRRFIDENTGEFLTECETSGVYEEPEGDDVVDFSTGIYSKSESTVLFNNSSPTVSDINRILEYYNKIKNMNETGITLYNSSKIVIDFLNNSISLDLLGKDEYTNTISLVGIEKKQARAGISAKIDLTVSYTIDSATYKEDLSFEALEYVEENSLPVLKRINFISQVGEVLIEYIDGIIRVIPASNNVDECIISNCIMTYGNL